MIERGEFYVPEMRRIRRIHFVGIGGSGMSGIAGVLLNQGICRGCCLKLFFVKH